MNGYDYAEWQRFYDERVNLGRCPYSGETIIECHRSDMCDCFDFDEDKPAVDDD